jgi:drug/metabolite transporter (DMT)-like permease
MHTRALKADALLLIAAMIWGLAFVAQRAGMDHLGPFAFNAIRFALGSLTLLPVWIVGRRRRSALAGADRGSASVMSGAALAGGFLFLGASLQQVGLVFTTAGKAGFITGLYVVLVPVLGLSLGQRVGRGGWAGALIAAAGLYLLSVGVDLTIGVGDGLVFASAFFWAAHVLIIGRWTRRVDAIELAALQFALCAVLSLLVAAIFESTSLEGIRGAAIPLLYSGVCSVGIGLTLQVLAQRRASPTATAILLSLEAVFAALGGWLLLGETLSPREILGCALMFAAVLVSQLWRNGPPPGRASSPEQ